MHRPPWELALTYLILVPLAGTIFWRLPVGSFYDANLSREAGYEHDIATAANMLTTSIEQQEYGYQPNHRPPAPKWNMNGIPVTVDTNSVYVPPESISVTRSGVIELEIRFFARGSPSASSFAQGEFSDAVALSPAAGYDSSSGSLLDLADIPVSLTAPSGLNISEAPLNALLPQIAGSTYPDRSIILIPRNAVVILEHLSGAGEGDPKFASGLFIRMCYFSAITITTLGFGDITPVSSLARVLVGLEAVLGVVIIGLFLNAVAQKWGRES
jgi:hypothetical protein